MLCPLMQLDFTDGVGRYDEVGLARYSNSDLHYGILWAEAHLTEGIKREPMKGFDLAAFAEWCKEKLYVPRRSVYVWMPGTRREATADDAPVCYACW